MDAELLTAGELKLLEDASVDDVHTLSMLSDLGLVGSAHDAVTAEILDSAFASLAKLLDRGLIRVGRVEYVDAGAPGRIAPVRHISESLSTVRAHVESSTANAADPTSWWFASWVVGTN